MDVNGSTAQVPSHGESLVRADIGSPDRQRELTAAVDLNHGNGMPGYIGKMSDVSWLQRVKAYLAGTFPGSDVDLGLSEFDEHSLQTSSISYWAEDDNILAIDEDYVDAHQLPPFSVALILTEAFFASLQGSIRLIERSGALQDLNALYSNAPNNRIPNWEKRRLLALLNTMWAVGAKWLKRIRLHQRQIPGQPPEVAFEDHLVYLARARSCGLDHRIYLDHPSIELIQGLAIVGLYLVANGSIHR